MKNKLYYLTRSFFPVQNGGGPMMRTRAVELLRSMGWDVTVVMPQLTANDIKTEDAVQIPAGRFFNRKLSALFERMGIYEDYLDPWVSKSFEKMKDSVTADSVVFATSGGELGTIKLGALLKAYTGCRLVVNFRDPLNYSFVNGLKVDDRFHVSREKSERKYLDAADLIVTSSLSHLSCLNKKYPHLKDRIRNNYFGYMYECPQREKITNDGIVRIAYSGSMLSDVQTPEILYEIFRKTTEKSKFELYFIGDTSKNKTLSSIHHPSIHCIDYMEHSVYIDFMNKNINAGFLSLTKDYYGACVPSKLYEYINLGIPVFAALPHGDAYDIINENGFGTASYYKDIDMLADKLHGFSDSTFLETAQMNLGKQRHTWSMESKIEELDTYLRELQ